MVGARGKETIMSKAKVKVTVKAPESAETVPAVAEETSTETVKAPVVATEPSAETVKAPVVVRRKSGAILPAETLEKVLSLDTASFDATMELWRSKGETMMADTVTTMRPLDVVTVADKAPTVTEPATVKAPTENVKVTVKAPETVHYVYGVVAGVVAMFRVLSVFRGGENRKGPVASVRVREINPTTREPYTVRTADGDRPADMTVPVGSLFASVAAYLTTRAAEIRGLYPMVGWTVGLPVRVFDPRYPLPGATVGHPWRDATVTAVTDTTVAFQYLAGSPAMGSVDVVTAAEILYPREGTPSAGGAYVKGWEMYRAVASLGDVVTDETADAAFRAVREALSVPVRYVDGITPESTLPTVPWETLTGS